MGDASGAGALPGNWEQPWFLVGDWEEVGRVDEGAMAAEAAAVALYGSIEAQDLTAPWLAGKEPGAVRCCLDVAFVEGRHPVCVWGGK